ncbi:hypothetical protein [Massilia psychrophila]|uniref:hypothetical protein n=1 Tax=Massilia psychrophila TaxID=1603353 RepID=UPI00117FF1A8|nr:hypothetical protein [Massilia psychrophila]
MRKIEKASSLPNGPQRPPSSVIRCKDEELSSTISTLVSIFQQLARQLLDPTNAIESAVRPGLESLQQLNSSISRHLTTERPERAKAMAIALEPTMLALEDLSTSLASIDLRLKAIESSFAAR